MMNAIRGQEVPWAAPRLCIARPRATRCSCRRCCATWWRRASWCARAAAGSGPTRNPGAGIPEGLRDVIGKRLSRLSEPTNQVLAVAAVIGRDFALDMLRGVAGLDEEALLAALEEAVRVAVVQEQSGHGAIRYRFAHAFFRQTLYEEIIAPRRLRLHQQVARALEAHYVTPVDEHAAELAEHFPIPPTRPIW